ncbi:MAG: NADH-quinone oxidoreductase subunit J [Acidimicrobiales bacterium]
MQLLLATATLPDTITFAIAAAICIVGSIGVVVSTHPVHSALMLVMTLFGVAVLFVEENAQFLAAVQVIVYAGAIVVLFLFVIMLLGVDRAEAIAADPLKGQRLTAMVLGALVLAEVVILGRGRWPTGAHSTAGALDQGTKPNVNILGTSIFTTYLLPFEITSALLVIAIIGAVVLARRPQRQGEAPEPVGDDATGDDGTGDDGAQLDPEQFDPARFDPARFDPAQLDPAQLDPAEIEDERSLS